MKAFLGSLVPPIVGSIVRSLASAFGRNRPERPRKVLPLRKTPKRKAAHKQVTKKNGRT